MDLICHKESLTDREKLNSFLPSPKALDGVDDHPHHSHSTLAHKLKTRQL